MLIFIYIHAQLMGYNNYVFVYKITRVHVKDAYLFNHTSYILTILIHEKARDEPRDEDTIQYEDTIDDKTCTLSKQLDKEHPIFPESL